MQHKLKSGCSNSFSTSSYHVTPYGFEIAAIDKQLFSRKLKILNTIFFMRSKKISWDITWKIILLQGNLVNNALNNALTW